MVEGPRIQDAVNAVLATLPCSVTLPAGAGKTELIAAAVSEVASQGGTSLVLTHTHAGVDVLRRRMQKFGVESDRVRVRTIDSWTYDLISHFPLLAELATPDAPDWGKSADYHRAAARAARSSALVRMLKVSYTHLFVDEYQDCLVDQHELILTLSAAIPAAVFGDPLQSLFNFSSNLPVDWNSEVIPNFPDRQIVHRPRRWDPNHQALGAWLVGIREQLLGGEPVSFASAPVNWEPRRHAQTHVSVCLSALGREGTVAVLGNQRWDCVSSASALNGAYTVMEALDEKVPLVLAEKIDTKGGAEVAQAVVKFAIDCSSKLAPHIDSKKRKQLGEGRSFTTRSEKLMPAYEAVRQVRSDPGPVTVRAALELLGELPRVAIHCREAWHEVLRAVTVAASEDCTVTEALQRTRNHSRAVGRKSSGRVVSRPLLVKGLEFDHVIILRPEKYSAQELYVALTRGSKSVTVISDSITLPVLEMATSRTDS